MRQLQRHHVGNAPLDRHIGNAARPAKSSVSCDGPQRPMLRPFPRTAAPPPGLPRLPACREGPARGSTPVPAKPHAVTESRLGSSLAGLLQRRDGISSSSPRGETDLLEGADRPNDSRDVRQYFARRMRKEVGGFERLEDGRMELRGVDEAIVRTLSWTPEGAPG
jgi:hypothetical protein